MTSGCRTGCVREVLLVDNSIAVRIEWDSYDPGVEEKLDLVGISEVAEMLGVTRQRVDKLSRTSPDFPQPVSTLHGGRVWLRSKIEEWATKTGRTK